MEGINIYKLLPAWYAFKLDKKLSGNHTDLFFYMVELNNRLGWIEVFGLPTQETAEVLNMSPNTLRKVLSDLASHGVVKVVKKAKNQLSANQVSMKQAYQNLLKLSNSDYTALVKATQQRLRGACAITIHKDLETSLHSDYPTLENGAFQKIETLEPQKQIENELPLQAEVIETEPMPATSPQKPPKQRSGMKLAKVSTEDRTAEFKAFLWAEINKGQDSQFWSLNNFQNAKEFSAYWCEASPKTGQLRCEAEKFFDMPRRMATWKKRANERNGHANGYNGQANGFASRKLQAFHEESQARDAAFMGTVELLAKQEAERVRIANLPPDSDEARLREVI